MRPPRFTPCTTPGCPGLRPRAQPCPICGHPKPWASSTRKTKTNLSGTAEQKRARRILRRDAHICHVCHQPGADTVDHVISLGEGGPDTDDNLSAIHARPCHEKKTLEEAQRARRAKRRGTPSES